MFDRFDVSERAIRAIGPLLAVASLAFLFGEASSPVGPPKISGVEHLAIYARPAAHKVASQSRERKNIDYAPVGSTRALQTARDLDTYEIIEASADRAIVRLPEGRILRLAPGATLAGLGSVLSITRNRAKWSVVTQGGVIRQN